MKMGNSNPDVGDSNLVWEKSHKRGRFDLIFTEKT